MLGKGIAGTSELAYVNSKHILQACIKHTLQPISLHSVSPGVLSDASNAKRPRPTPAKQVQVAKAAQPSAIKAESSSFSHRSQVQHLATLHSFANFHACVPEYRRLQKGETVTTLNAHLRFEGVDQVYTYAK